MPVGEPLVPNANYTPIQYHVLDQFAHAAVLRRLLMKRKPGHAYLPLVERTLKARYDDCVAQDVEAAAREIQERLVATAVK